MDMDRRSLIKTGALGALAVGAGSALLAPSASAYGGWEVQSTWMNYAMRTPVNSIYYRASVNNIQDVCSSILNDYSLKRDGVFGPATQSFLIRAQRARHLTADGVFGPATARAFDVSIVSRVDPHMV